MNLKKIVLATATVIAMSAPAYAVDPSAVVIWSGTVSGSNAGDTMVITGLGGGAIGRGIVSMNQDGTFSSNNSIILEARNNDGTADAPTIGDLVTAASWKITDINVLIPGVDTAAITAATKVYDGTTLLEVGTAFGTTAEEKNTLDLTVANAVPVEGIKLAARLPVDVQVSLVASAAL